ncbi:MAG: FkbM family methyltransferase [Planctomycetales bacterium]
MTTRRMNCRPAFLGHILREQLLTHDFFLVDVGASGGIDPIWRKYGDRLKAVGFDPLIKEVDRLREQEGRGKVRYEAAFVGDHETEKAPGAHWLHRTSAAAALELKRSDRRREVYNSGLELVFSDRRIELDQFFPRAEWDEIDFLKVDTDGHDFPVLLGAEGLLREGKTLGLCVEANFAGPDDERANVFANIDRFLRRAGFSLFDLDLRRYSRSSLPLPFVHDFPAETHDGQTMWAEAVYFRDPADPQSGAAEFSEQKTLKLASLFELFGLPDCAAELLLACRDRFPPLSDPRLLNLLTPPLRGQRLSHADYLNAIRQKTKAFHPKPRHPLKAALDPLKKMLRRWIKKSA